MAVYKLFPLQDATIYSFYPDMNTGIDPIIEVGNLNVNINPVPQVFRYLIEFDQSEINTVIDTIVSSSDRSASDFSSSLKCYIANAQGVDFNSFLEIYPISGSWNNGTGQFLNNPQTQNGCCWSDRLSSGSGAWANNSNLNDFVTASYSGSDGEGGGNWYTGSNDVNLIISSSQTFNVRTIKDINLNVTDIVKIWYSSSKKTEYSIDGDFVEIENNGFILKWEDNIEFNQTQGVQPIYKSYAVDTNTIYPPVLEVKWDDQIFETGSLPEIATTDLFISLDSNPGVFYSESINRFRLNCRPEFPDRIYSTQSATTVNHYINSSSLYAVKDLDTNEFVIDFDPQFTKISCDAQSNYFDIYMNGLEPERYYQILIQTVISGSTIVMDEKYYFKVVNG